jgi:hypothetical protein
MSSSVEPRRPSKPDEPEAVKTAATMAVVNPVQRKSSIGKLDNSGSSTTIALGGDTYTIGKRESRWRDEEALTRARTNRPQVPKFAL